MKLLQDGRQDAAIRQTESAESPADVMDFLHRLIEAQKQMNRSLARADAEAIGAAASEIEAVLSSGSRFKTANLQPHQARARMDARVLLSTILDWQDQNRELGRHSLRIVRRLCGMQADPSYNASGNLDDTAEASKVGVCI